MVVPARAGMSPAVIHAGNYGERGPRASGDEPGSESRGEKLGVWSPRERG